MCTCHRLSLLIMSFSGGGDNRALLQTAAGEEAVAIAVRPFPFSLSKGSLRPDRFSARSSHPEAAGTVHTPNPTADEASSLTRQNRPLTFHV